MREFRLFLIVLLTSSTFGYPLVSGCGNEPDTHLESRDSDMTSTDSADLEVDTCEGESCQPQATDIGGDTEPQTSDVISCNAIDICRECCQAGPCFRACEEVAGPQNFERFKAKNDCRYTTCKSDCNAGAKSCYECWDRECAEEFAACTWNPVGSLTCGQLFDCVNKCEKVPTYGSATSCTQSPGLWCNSNCLSSGDADATQKFDAYNKCTRDACINECKNYGQNQAGTDKCNQCINERCAAELTACVKD